MKANLHGVSRVSDSTLGVRSAVEVVVVVLARWCLGELGDVQRLEGPSVSILELSRGTRGPTYMVLVGCQLASKLVGYTVGKAEDGVLWAQGICSRLSISRGLSLLEQCKGLLQEVVHGLSVRFKEKRQQDLRCQGQ